MVESWGKLSSRQVFYPEVFRGHSFVHSGFDVLQRSHASHRLYPVPRFELRRLHTFLKRRFFVLPLIPAVPVLGLCSGIGMDAPDTVLLGVAVLTAVASRAEGLELEVFGGKGEQ